VRRKMDDWKMVLVWVAVLGMWFALQRWILPRFGVKT
jgi:hypothetical protein